MDFKVGDKVRIISQSFSFGPINIGDIGIINGVTKLPDYTRYTIELPNHCGWLCKAKDIELVNTSPEYVKLRKEVEDFKF